MIEKEETTSNVTAKKKSPTRNEFIINGSAVFLNKYMH